MEYTDRERTAFKDAYATRWRRKVIGIALLFAVMAPLAISGDDATLLGLSMSVVGPILLVAIFAGWWIFESRNWRCPACDKNLGRAFNPKHCRNCGIELRAQREARGSIR